VINNWLVTAWLASPLAGEPPYLDGILAWELAYRLGACHASKTGRWTPPEGIADFPVPLAKRTIGGYDVNCCSAPILPPLHAPEWIEYTSGRFEASKLALAIEPECRKMVTTASGTYKSRHSPERVRLADRVCWFVRGDKKEIHKLLKSVHAIGHRRDVGYGLVWKWTYEMTEQDYSIFAPCDGSRVLMKSLPICESLKNVRGYRLSYGGWRPPYWHPAFFAEVAIPC